MPQYLNDSDRIISIQDNNNTINISREQTIKTKGLHNHIKGLIEKSPYPNITPVLQEDCLSGETNEEFIINISRNTKSIKIINRSGSDIVLFYNNSNTQGMTIINQTGEDIDFNNKEFINDVEKIVIKLLGECISPRSIIIDQYRQSLQERYPTQYY